MKLENGDAFEARYAGWIRSHLPSYELIWKTFIGHDGNGWPLPMEGLAPEQEQDRKKFYQAHYTLAVDAKQLDKLAVSIDEASGVANSLDDFLETQQDLLNLLGLVGRMRDMLKLIDGALRAGGSLCNPMQDFYTTRSHVLHGPRMPVRFDDGFLMISKIAGQNANFGEWDDKSTWDSVASFVTLADFCRELRDGVFDLVRNLHPKIFSAADKRFGGKQIQQVVEVVLPPQPFGDYSSAPAISAQFLPISGSLNPPYRPPWEQGNCSTAG